MIKPIVTKENPVLREIAQEVPLGEIASSRIQEIIKNMKATLETQDDGVALAAPQINEPLRIFVVSPKIFDLMYPDEEEKKGTINLVYINPQITKLSKEKRLLEEGCLSIRHWYGKIRRSTKASVKAYDEKGKAFERGGIGLLAQIFQHETDHLNGILFIDSAKNLVDLPPEKGGNKKGALARAKKEKEKNA